MARKATKIVADEVLVPSTPPVSAPSDRHPRMLLVEFIGDAPKICFKGDWSVRHLLTIKRCISREFKLYRRDVLRNTPITTKEE